MVASFAVLGCRDHTAPQAVAPVPGCYRLSLGSWSAPHEAPDVPSTIHLFDSLGTNLLEAGRLLIRPAADSTYFPYFAWWERPRADSLNLVFTTGFIGVRVSMTPHNASWRGRAEALTDVQPQVQATATASLASSACS